MACQWPVKGLYVAWEWPVRGLCGLSVPCPWPVRVDGLSGGLCGLSVACQMACQGPVWPVRGLSVACHLPVSGQNLAFSRVFEIFPAKASCFLVF